MELKQNKRSIVASLFLYNTKVDGQRNTCCFLLYSCCCCCFFSPRKKKGILSVFCAGAVCVEGRRRRTSRLRVLMSRRGRMEIVMDGPFLFLFLALWTLNPFVRSSNSGNKHSPASAPSHSIRNISFFNDFVCSMQGPNTCRVQLFVSKEGKESTKSTTKYKNWLFI
jgi:hypothetical protein